jgi:hypothetical protein
MASDDPDDMNERAQRSRIPKDPGHYVDDAESTEIPEPNEPGCESFEQGACDNLAYRQILSKMGTPPSQPRRKPQRYPTNWGPSRGWFRRLRLRRWFVSGSGRRGRGRSWR